jgi:hypothetical protein
MSCSTETFSHLATAIMIIWAQLKENVPMVPYQQTVSNKISRLLAKWNIK